MSDLTKEERDQWRREARKPASWQGADFTLEHANNTDRLLAALDALDALEVEHLMIAADVSENVAKAALDEAGSFAAAFKLCMQGMRPCCVKLAFGGARYPKEPGK